MKAVVPVLECLVEIVGEGEQKVSNITFRGITFVHSSWLRPSLQGHVASQADQWLYDAYSDYTSIAGNVAWVGRPASAVSVSDARDISFLDCDFRQTASTAVDFVKGTKNMTVRGCIFCDVGGSAVLAGYFGDETFEVHEPYNPDNNDVVCDSITIDNNYIAHVATEDWGCLGICMGYASNVTISHNEIYDTPYSAINMGWGWTSEMNCMKNNHIHSFCNQMRDGGAIYTLSSQPRSTIAGNRIEDVGNPPNTPLMWAGMSHAQFDIYLDEGSDYFTVRNNWCERGEFSKNKNGSHNVWGTNNSSVSQIYKSAAGLEDAYSGIKERVTEPDMAPLDSIVDNSVKGLEYPSERVSVIPVRNLVDGEEYALQNSNTSLTNRNLYWEWGTYLRSHDTGSINDVTVIAHRHVAEDSQEQWSFQISSETGDVKYLGCDNGANVQIVSDERLWTVTYSEDNGFVLLPAGKNENEEHEMMMNGSGDWVVCYENGDSDDRTESSSYWSFYRNADLDDSSLSQYNNTNLLLYKYLVEARQMTDRGITSLSVPYTEGLAVYNKDDNTVEELQNAIDKITEAISSSVDGYEVGVAATYGVINPGFENLSNQHDTDCSVPFGWTMTKDGNVIDIPTQWSWCGCNADGENKEGTYIWGMWNWGSYGNIELSQTLSGLPDGLWKVTARLMNNNTESGNLVRVFAGNSSMLAGGPQDYTSTIKDEFCNYGNAWSISDRDMRPVMTAYTRVSDGALIFGVRTNGFFKTDDFSLTYLGNDAAVEVTVSEDRPLAISLSAPVDFSSVNGVRAYKVNSDGETTELTGVVSAGQPMLLIGDGGVYDLPVTLESDVADMKGNMLRVANGDVKADGATIYMLSDGESGIGFYLLKKDDVVGSGDVYLLTGKADNKSFLPIIQTSTGETRITDREQENDVRHDVMGRTLGDRHHGVVISEGKKILLP